MNNTTDLFGAIAALSSMLDSMEKRQKSIEAELQAAKRNRNQQLDQRVAALLPNLSMTTVSRLQLEVPAFATDRKVVSAFKQNRKILGLFKPSGYNEGLALLQINLKFFLEQQGFTRETDQSISKLEIEKTALSAKQSEALDMLRLMEKANRINAPLPTEAASTINQIAQRGRAYARAGTGNVQTTHSRLAGGDSGARQTPSDSDSDLWLWMMTDIPTSLRTLMLGAISQHHHSDGVHASKAPDAQVGICDVSTKVSTDEAPSQSVAACEPIATDDRLGAFS